MHTWERVARLARLQHGVISRQQLQELGVEGSLLTDRVRSKGWQRLRPGVFSLPGTAPTPQQHIAAALLSLGPPCAASGWTDAWLRGMVKNPPRTVHIMIPRARRPRPRPGVSLHASVLFDPQGLERVQHIPVTDVHCSLAILAPTVSDQRMAALLATACRRRLTTLEQTAGWLGCQDRFVGRPRFRRVVGALRGELTHSGDESKARGVLSTAGLQPYPQPFAVIIDGRPVAEIDIAFLAERYGIEIDGPAHLLPEQIRRDKARDRMLERHGWRIDRFTIDEIEEDPARFVREVTQALEQRRRELRLT